MFGWFKRQDGFEWRNYVRTTILVRREKRRQRIDDARIAAVDGIKDAGRKGAEIGVSGLNAAGRSAGSALWRLFDMLRAGFGRAAARTGAALSGMAPQMTDTLRGIAKPGLSLPLLVVAVVAAIAALARLPSRGLDREAMIAAGLAVLALLGAVMATGGGWGAASLTQVGKRLGAAWPGFAGAGGRLRTALHDGRSGLSPRTLATAAAVVGLSGLLALGIWLAPAVGPQQAATALGAAKPGASAQRLTGRAQSRTGDMLRIDGTTVKLAGIEAPDRDQSCQRVGARPWPCGRAATDALAKLVRSKDVTCDLSGTDAGGNALGTCRLGDVDIADTLVRNGHVFAETGLFASYSSAEGAARAAKAGVWSGEIERPSAYRAKRWDDAKRAAPDGCPIKGQVTSGERVYVLPWSPGYDRAKVRTTRGERWFCSEKEAVAAGWKPVERS